MDSDHMKNAPDELDVKFMEWYAAYLEMQKRSLIMQLNEIGRQLEAIKEIRREMALKTPEDK